MPRLALIRPATTALLALVVAAPVALLQAGPAHADYDLGVTWPTTSAINPAGAPYTFTVRDTGPGDLYAEWQGVRTPVPHEGDHTMAFSGDGTGRIVIVRCVEGACEWAGVASPVLSVYSQVTITSGGGGLVTSPAVGHAYLRVAPFQPLAPITVAWSLRADAGAGAEVASGTAETLLTNTGDALFDYDVPADLPSGRYGMSLVASTDLGAGLLTSPPFVGTTVVDVDPPVVTVGLSVTDLYPERDKYRDTLSVSVSANEYGRATVGIVDPNGEVVETILAATTITTGSGRYPQWSGKIGGQVAPPGEYAVRAEFTDSAGNTTVDDTPFTVHAERITRLTYTTKIKAKAAMISKSVGACSRLRSPASRRWAGSLGFESRVKCSRASADKVAARFSVSIPKAINKRYETFRVSGYGGRATSGTGTLTLAYLRASDDSRRSVVQLGTSLGWHSGAVRNAIGHVRTPTTEPTIEWVAYLGRGKRYDLKSWRVEVEYFALALPTAARAVGR